jgi:hypothetical protein
MRCDVLEWIGDDMQQLVMNNIAHNLSSKNARGFLGYLRTLLAPYKHFSADYRYSNAKLYENPSSGTRRSSRRTDITKLRVACRGFANAPENYSKSYENQFLNLLRDS